MFIPDSLQRTVADSLAASHGEDTRTRIELGVKRVAAFWTEADGSADDFIAFCGAHFIGEKDYAQAFASLDAAFETLHGYFNAMSLNLRRPLDEDTGPIRPHDMLLGEFDPSAHLIDDLFKNQIAFVVLLNFPHRPLEEKQTIGAEWDAATWARVRIGDVFQSRVPAELQQELASVITAADTYIAEYNICMGSLRDADGKALFPEDLKLISHWGIRDELKSHYGQPEGRARQEIIYTVMNRIVTQQIPAAVINNPKLTWNPYDNIVTREGAPVAVEEEVDRRYRHIRNIFTTMTKIDRHYPAFPTYLQRKFEQERELPESVVEQLFIDFLSSPKVNEIGALIERRLGRSLRPYDIWYDGFKPRGSISSEKLDRIVAEKYVNLDDFTAGIPEILADLGFSAKQVDFIVPKIEVDASRGAGHAWGASMRAGKSHLRTRVPRNGMNHKGFSIGVHELGHVVEQTLSLHRAPYHMLHGVPISGISEAFAFIFQHRDLELLGLKNPDTHAEHLATLDQFWTTREIMAVSLVDMRMWHWLYDNPGANAVDLKKAVIDIARSVWNKYFGDLFGARDEMLPAIYSHMLGHPLYLAEYALGHIMQFQIERYLQGKTLGTEMERMCAIGSVVPQLWMKLAVGSEISIAPLLSAVDEALAAVGR